MTVSIEEFNDYVTALERHDWQFEYSDDHRVWQSGMNAEKTLQAKILQAPEYNQAYRLYHDYYYSRDMSREELIAGINQIRQDIQNQTSGEAHADA